MARILAVDQASRVSGYAFSIDEEPVTYGLLTTPGGKRGLRGLDACVWQCEAVAGLLDLHAADTLALENIYIPDTRGEDGRSNAHTVFILGALRGMLYNEARRRGLQVVLIDSSEVCQALGISSFSSRIVKKRAARLVAASALWGDRTRWQELTEDEADALTLLRIAEGNVRLAQAIAAAV